MASRKHGPSLLMPWAPVTLGKGVGWYDSAAALDADFANGRFRWDGVTYNDEAAFLTAIGGTKATTTYRIGPYVAPAASEMMVNGDFASGTTGWNNQLSGLLSEVAGEGSLDGNSGTNPGFSRQITGTVVGTGYYGRSKRKRGTTFNGTISIVSPNANLGSGIIASPTNSTTVYADTGYAFAGRGTLHHGGRLAGAGVTGTGIWDDFSVKVASMFKGQTNGGGVASAGKIAGRVYGRTPATIGSTLSLLSFDGNTNDNDSDGNSQDSVRIQYGTDNHLHVLVTSGNVTAADLDLGVKAVDTDFDIWFSFGQNRFAAALDGGAIVADTTGDVPGMTNMRLGRDRSGNTWTGTLKRLTVWDAERVPANLISMEGDSYTVGSGGVSLVASLATATSRAVFNTGLGGSTLAESVARVQANPGLYRGVFVHWDGDANGYTDVATTMANYAALIAALGHGRYVIVPPCRRSNNDSAENTATTTIQSQLMTLYGATHIVDAQAILASHATSPGDDTDVASNYIPASLLQGDGTHLTSTGMGYVATAVDALLDSNGW